CNHPCLFPDGRGESRSELPRGRPPGWNFPGTWSVVGRAGILRSVWYGSYYVNGATDLDVVSRARAARARGAVDAVRPRAPCGGDPRQLLDLPPHAPLQRAAATHGHGP